MSESLNLPQWNLSILYKSSDDEKISQDMQKITQMCDDFCSYKGKIDDLSGDKLLEMVCKYEKICEFDAKLQTFAYLNYATDISDSKSAQLLQNIGDFSAKEFAKLTFFEVEICNIPEDKMENLLDNSEELRQYSSFLRDICKFREHILSSEIESILLEKDACCISAITRIFDEHLASLRFSHQNKDLTITEAIDLLSNKDGEIRREIGFEIGKVFDKNSWFYAIILNTIAQNTKLSTKWRSYKHFTSARNLSNFIEDDIVFTLRDSVVSKYTQISHRYYKIKAKLLNKEKLEFYDRNAPILLGDDSSYSFEEAKKIVIKSYSDFSPKMAEIVEEFFDNNWIEARVLKHKMSGAFCCPTPENPFVLMSYLGKARDIATLAHELGHGVHMYLSKKQPFIMQNTPLTFAETASLFGEQLVFENILKSTTTKNGKISILCQKLDDTINTIIRQVAFFDFEQKIHQERINGEIAKEKIAEIWLETQKNSLGEYVNLPAEYQNYWVYISHFIHSPFYVYAYAFGNLLVNSLYSEYKKGVIDNFHDKYIQMLSCAGTLHHRELLAPFGLDISKKDFWQSGLEYISKMIDELENVTK